MDLPHGVEPDEIRHTDPYGVDLTGDQHRLERRERPAGAELERIGFCGRCLAIGGVAWWGLAGLMVGRGARSVAGWRGAGEAMTKPRRPRGRDDGGFGAEAEGGVVLGQRRFAIIDLSRGGAQPMHSADRRYVIT